MSFSIRTATVAAATALLFSSAVQAQNEDGFDIDQNVLDLYVESRIQQPADRATPEQVSTLRDQLNTNLSVGGVYLNFPKSVEVSSLYLEDQKGDTLLYLGSLEIRYLYIGQVGPHDFNIFQTVGFEIPPFSLDEYGIFLAVNSHYLASHHIQCQRIFGTDQQSDLSRVSGSRAITFHGQYGVHNRQTG